MTKTGVASDTPGQPLFFVWMKRSPPLNRCGDSSPKGGAWVIPAARAALWQRRAHLALRPAPQRLPLNKQGSNAANLQRIASAEGGNSSDPLQPEPPLVAAARATNKDGAGVRGNRYSIPPAAFRRFRRAKAASQAAGKTSGKRYEHLCRCGEEQLPRSPSVIGLRPLTAPSRREPWNGPHMSPSCGTPQPRRWAVHVGRKSACRGESHRLPAADTSLREGGGGAAHSYPVTVLFVYEPQDLHPGR